MPMVKGFSTSPSKTTSHGRIGSFSAAAAMRLEEPNS